MSEDRVLESLILSVMVVVFFSSLLWEEHTYRKSHEIVRKRWDAGDTTCMPVKKWWGWAVKEYAEETNEPL